MEAPSWIRPPFCLPFQHNGCSRVQVASLMGGAKTSAFDTVKRRIGNALESHGVPFDQSRDRVLAFAAKADLEGSASLERMILLLECLEG